MITFSFPTRGGTVLSHPPTLIINDGSIYPYAVSGNSCNDGICFNSQSKIDFSAQCDGKSISVKGYSSIHFSFYTPDGDSGSVYGYNDFLVEDTVNDDTVKVFGKDGQKIGIVTTKEVVGKYDPSAPGKGGFPTTLVTFSLLPYLKQCGNSYIKVPVVFEKGDLLILSHKIEALTSNPNRKLDGNKDGILEYSAVDDLKLVFDGSKFVEQK